MEIDGEHMNHGGGWLVDEAGKMNKMVKQLLTLTALEFGNDTPSMEPFDLSELIREFANSSGILIQQNAARLELEIPEKLVALGDEVKIEEVLTNYLTNAMNHLDGERTIRIRAEKEKDRAKVSVYNAGQPIPEEDIPNAHHWILLHGRYVCKSAKPECSKCQFADICPKLLKDSKLE